MSILKNKKDFKVGTVTTQAMLLRDFTEGVTGAGKKFLRGVLGVHDGDLPFVFWGFDDVTDKDAYKEELRQTSVVWVEFEVGLYNGETQLTVSSRTNSLPAFEAISLDDPRLGGDTDYLIRSTAIDVPKAFNEIDTFIKNVENTTYSFVLTELMTEYKTRFLTYPAAEFVHHDYKGGLLEHTYEMFNIAKGIMDNLIIPVDEELVLTAIILHDLMKIEEYEVNDLSTPIGVTLAGRLEGHIFMMASRIKEFSSLGVLDEDDLSKLTHMILSHHGQPDWGSAIRPLFFEAELVHLVDLISARSNSFHKHTEGLEPLDFTTRRVYTLDNRYVTKVSDRKE